MEKKKEKKRKGKRKSYYIHTSLINKKKSGNKGMKRRKGNMISRLHV